MVPNFDFPLIRQPFSKHRHYWNNFSAIGGLPEVGDERFKDVVRFAEGSSVAHIQSFPKSSSNTANGISPRCFRAVLEVARTESESRAKEITMFCEVPPQIMPLQGRLN